MYEAAPFVRVIVILVVVILVVGGKTKSLPNRTLRTKLGYCAFSIHGYLIFFFLLAEQFDNITYIQNVLSIKIPSAPSRIQNLQSAYSTDPKPTLFTTNVLTAPHTAKSNDKQ